MATPFNRTLQSLATESDRPAAAWVAGAGALLTAWIAWACLTRVPVYEATPAGRIELGQGSLGVQAPVSAAVTRSALALGESVTAGQVLVELDSRTIDEALALKRSERAALGARLAAVEAETEAEREALALSQREHAATLAEARAREHEAAPRVEHARELAERLGRAYADGALAEHELSDVKSRAETAERGLTALDRGFERLRLELQRGERDREVRIRRLERDLSEVKGELATLDAAVGALEAERDERRLRAPVSGVLSSVTSLQLGAYVEAGDVLFHVVPEAGPRAVAWFQAARAVGRVRPGQRARLRLDGFPWTRYGMLAGHVDRIGSDPTSGQVQVELALDTGGPLAFPVQHGMTARIEVEVERVSPLTLLLRACGSLGDIAADSTPTVVRATPP